VNDETTKEAAVEEWKWKWTGVPLRVATHRQRPRGYFVGVFLALACPGPPGPVIGEKLWAVDDSASGGLVTFCSSRLPPPIPAIQFDLPIKIRPNFHSN